MLTAEEKQEIEAEMAQYPTLEAVRLGAMNIVQRHRGWVSDESIRDIGELLNASPADLDSLATFYNLIFRKPVGRNVIMLCDSVSCWIMGFNGIREHFAEHLGIRFGETTHDNRFTLLPIVCLGACEQAPAMILNNELHGNLDPAKIDGFLEDCK